MRKVLLSGVALLSLLACGPDKSVGSKLKISDGREVGDNVNGLRRFPWVALLDFPKPDGSVFRCSGSVVNGKQILTAAHCVPFSQSGIVKSVRVKISTLDMDVDQMVTIDRKLKMRATVHQSYDRDTQDSAHDLAFLNIVAGKSFDLRNYMDLTTLTDSKEISSGDRVSLAGYGASEWVVTDDGEVLSSNGSGILRVGGNIVTVVRDNSFFIEGTSHASHPDKKMSLGGPADSGSVVVRGLGLKAVGVMSGGGTVNDGQPDRDNFNQITSLLSPKNLKFINEELLN